MDQKKVFFCIVGSQKFGESANAKAVMAFWWPLYSLIGVPPSTRHNLIILSDEHVNKYCESNVNAQSQTQRCPLTFKVAESLKSAVRQILAVWSADVVASKVESGENLHFKPYLSCISFYSTKFFVKSFTTQNIKPL